MDKQKHFDPERSAAYESRFRLHLEQLETHIGYTFRNRDLLIQAVTAPSFGSVGRDKRNPQYPCNNRLEVEGDDILEKTVDSWLFARRDLSPGVMQAVRNFLNSNLYLSSVGLDIGLDRCVRFSLQRARVQSVESKIRSTANAVEALIAAVDRDSAGTATEQFFNRHIFPEVSRNRVFQRMYTICSGSIQLVTSSFAELTDYQAEIRTTEAQGITYVFLHYAGEVYSSRVDRRPAADVASDLVLNFLNKHPWFLWGYSGPVSLVLPCAADDYYGTSYEDQSDYCAEVVPTITTDRFQEVEVSLPPPMAHLASREEFGWDLVDLPPPLPSSTSERGPYIDKLRYRVGEMLEVRARHFPKEVYPRYAFFIADRHLHTTRDRKNINDAASEVLRQMLVT